MGTTYIVLVVLMVITVTLASSWLNAHNLSLFSTSIVGFSCAATIYLIGNDIDAYEPSSKWDARISNEKIKLLVGSFNAAGLTAIAAGALNPIITDLSSDTNISSDASDLGPMLWIAIGTYIHIKARNLLNFLKDEDAFEVVQVPTT